MSGIALAQTVSRGTDTGIDIQFVGINYDQTRVIIRLEYQPSGQTKDYAFEGAALVALRNGVSNFSGLRVALLNYLQTLDNALGGSVT